MDADGLAACETVEVAYSVLVLVAGFVAFARGTELQSAMLEEVPAADRRKVAQVLALLEKHRTVPGL